MKEIGHQYLLYSDPAYRLSLPYWIREHTHETHYLPVPLPFPAAGRMSTESDGSTFYFFSSAFLLLDSPFFSFLLFSCTESERKLSKAYHAPLSLVFPTS